MYIIAIAGRAAHVKTSFLRSEVGFPLVAAGRAAKGAHCYLKMAAFNPDGLAFY